MSDVGAVVPTHENLLELTRCIASLQAQQVPLSQVIVCVDGSTDGTLEYLEDAAVTSRVPIRVRTHPGNVHRGRAVTRNLALDLLDDDYVWFVDSDMVPATDALGQHLSLVESRACASQGQVVYANADESPWAGYLNTRAYHRRPHGAVIPFTWYSAANSLVRTAHVQELRGFDARFVGYGGEDFDFAYRLQCVSREPLINNRNALAMTVEHKSIERALAQFEEYGSTNLHLLESLHSDLPRTFELQRLDSRALVDRAFVATLNPSVERVVDALIRIGPRRLRNQLLNYKVISAVWRGYRSGLADR